MRSLLALLVACTPPEPADDPPVHVTTPEQTVPDPPDPPEPPAPVPWTAETTVPPALPPVLTISPPGGVYDAPVEVTITVDPPDATVVYTTDGAVPVVGVSWPYTGPFTVEPGTLVRIVSETPWGRVTAAPSYLAMDPALAGFSTDLPVMVLWTEADAPEWKSDVYTTFTVSTFEPVLGAVSFPADAVHSARAGLKVRGSSSAGYPKRPYRLEVWQADSDTDLGLPLLGLPEDGDWILLAPLDFDRAFIRDALMYAISNSIGRYAARTRFMEVFVAERGEPVGVDDYVGIYVLEERLERGNDRVAIAELLPTDVAEPEVTGGYLFKEDRTGPGESGFYAGTAGGLLDFQQPFVFADPSEAEIVPEQEAYLVAVLDDLAGALVAPDQINPVTGHHYEDVVDLGAFIDHHIVNVFAKNPDAFRLSGYFHKDREGLLAAGPVWDFDRTIGCTSDSRCDDPTWWDASNQTSDTTRVFDHGFWDGFFTDPLFRIVYFQRLGDLLDNELSKATVDALIDGMAAELGDAAPRSYGAWPSYPPRNGGFDAEIEHLRGWLDARRAWMQGCLALPDPRDCQGD